ncbi:hypothetical protein [Jejuia pallidilutea]|jgi:hypothetical protein|uniref:Uncharacterized protein n=1 Tax=Jejuia pallidilutea TaxID=504487 RepID=A0A090WMM0_9FLAO|nr:hypothetical protein [Jejuia pallidilutea]PQV45070.1 hypothetical protein CLV33_11537 [Jejuia pallidilutea]GAL68697.1 hypothetical protein JCM19301_3284 [Jejuia pallidilutea]GAL72258.1 hypothetical protein JCM19302_3 [Jejuia pallidilutea]GAL89230.1 hypothetical protein JCM19538_3310 [Jejuia pallidilutea]
MENPFKQINRPLKEVPPELKAKVMSDIAMAKLIMELAALFSYNIGHVIETVIREREKK